MRDVIIGTATKMFFKQGVRSVTLDDLSSELGISKKTLYQYFSNKEELVEEVISQFMNHHTSIIEKLMVGSQNSIEGFYQTANHVYMIFNSISPATIFETKKYYPAIWNRLQDFKKRSIEKLTMINLQKGISEGLYREDINADMVMRFYLTIVLNMNDEELFPETIHNPGKIYQSFINYHIRSIATEKGYAMFKQLSRTEDLQQTSASIK